MKTRCILSKSAMFLISFECERLAQMPAVTRKIHSPVKLVRRLMNRRWSSASISIVLAVCSRKAWETKKGHERERVTESPGYFRGEKKGEGKKQREGEDTPSESRNSIDPVRLTTPALRWSTDGRLMKGRSKTDASSISLHWRCNVFACGHVRIVYFREHSSIYRSIDRSIDRRERLAQNRFDFFEYPFPLTARKITFSNNELRERWILFLRFFMLKYVLWICGRSCAI